MAAALGLPSYGTMAPQLPPQLNVAETQDMSPMQASQLSAAAFTDGSFAARSRQL